MAQQMTPLIFEAKNGHELQKEVAEWYNSRQKQYPCLKITDIAQSSYIENKTWYLTLTILYEM